MRRVLVGVTAISIMVVVAIVFVEGLFSIIQWQKFDQGIVYSAYRLVVPVESGPATASDVPIASRA